MPENDKADSKKAFPRKWLFSSKNKNAEPKTATLPAYLCPDLLGDFARFVEKTLHISYAILDENGDALLASPEETDAWRKGAAKDAGLARELKLEALKQVAQTGEPFGGRCDLGVTFSYIPVMENGRPVFIWRICEEERRFSINPARFRLAQRTLTLAGAITTRMLEERMHAHSQLAKQKELCAQLKEMLSYTVFENDILGSLSSADDPFAAIESALEQTGEFFSLSRISVCRIKSDVGKQEMFCEWMAPTHGSLADLCRNSCLCDLWQTPELLNWFDRDGFFYSDTLEAVPETLKQRLAQDKTAELLQTVIKTAGRPVAIMMLERGENGETDSTPWDANRLTGLKAVAALLSGFILQKLAFDVAAQAQELMHTIADGSGALTYAVDQSTRRILFMNRALKQKHPELRPGDLCARLEHLDPNQTCNFCPLGRFSGQPEGQDTGQPVHEQIRYEIYKSSIDVWFELVASRFSWFDGSPACLVSLTDISSRKRFELEVEKLAYYDAMLDIPNRACLVKVLQKAFEEQSAPKDGAIIIMDLDDFKYVNDTLGSQHGDELLSQIVQYFNENESLVGKAFRFGGDEFLIFLQECAVESAIQTANELIVRFGRPWKVFEAECTCTASLGIATFPSCGNDPKTIVASAEYAVYEAKASGKNRYVLYDETLSQKNARRHRIQEILRRSLREQSFEVYYQPIYSIDKGFFTKAEALLRLKDAELGFIPPDEFISIAEEIGLIWDIGLFVVDRVCRDLCEFAQKGISLDSVAINISPVQLAQENFVDSMWNVISRYELPPTILEFEITENVVIRSFETITKTMAELQRYGIRFVLDDFGSGYSGLNYLLMLPISSLKIDKSYINQLEDSAKSRKMLSKIIELVQDFNMQVVAEGVETSFQDSILKEYNCDYIQGYLYSRPLPLGDFEALVGPGALFQ